MEGTVTYTPYRLTQPHTAMTTIVTGFTTISLVLAGFLSVSSFVA